MGSQSTFSKIYGEPFVSPIIRPQYVSLAEVDSGHQYSTGDYGLRALLPKLDKKGLKFLLENIAEVAGCDLESVNELEKHPLLDKKRNFRDGDDPKHVEKEGHAGTYFFNVGSINQPETYTIDPESGEPVECHPKEIYAGCYCQLVLQPCLYDEGMVTFYLNAVMKVEDGDRFKASRIDAKSLFTNWAAKGNVKDAPAVVKKVSKVVEEVEEEEEDEVEEAPKRGRGRPPKATNGKHVASKVVQEHDEETDEVEDEDEEEEEVKAAPVIVKREKKLKQSIADLLD